jgi:hypothetical protein
MVALSKVTTTHLAPSAGAEQLVHIRRRSPAEAASDKVPSTARHACQFDNGATEQAHPLGYSSLLPREVTISIPPLIGNGP